MTLTDLVALLPMIMLAITPLVILTGVIFTRSHLLTLGITLAGTVASVATIPVAMDAAPQMATALLQVDGFALFFTGLFAVTTAVVALLAWDYLEKREVAREEFYALITLGALGSAVLATAAHFASLFLGLELLSVSLYGLIAYLRESNTDIEAGLKYLILAAAASAFLIFGIALIYASTGSLELEVLAGLGPTGDPPALIGAGVALVVVGAGFKLALVPFHLWAADVYQGAPAPATAFVTTVSKGGMLAVVLRIIQIVGETQGELFWIVGGIAILSMIVGNLLALLQTNVKRLLAYSSIAQLGYIFVAALAVGDLGVRAATYYLVAYTVTILGAFGVVSLLSTEAGEPEAIADYRGLFWRRPGLAAVFSVMLLSLAGIPLTAGFLGKLYLLLAGIGSGLWWLAVALAAGSSIGIFYYLRVIVAMFSEIEEGEPRGAVADRMHPVGHWVLGALTVVLVFLGVYPMPLVALMAGMF